MIKQFIFKGKEMVKICLEYIYYSVLMKKKLEQPQQVDYYQNWIKLDLKQEKIIYHQGGNQQSIFDWWIVFQEECQIITLYYKERNLNISIVLILKSIKNKFKLLKNTFQIQTFFASINFIQFIQQRKLKIDQKQHIKSLILQIIQLKYLGYGEVKEFLALNASLAFRCLIICLVPEFDLKMIIIICLLKSVIVIAECQLLDYKIKLAQNAYHATMADFTTRFAILGHVSNKNA
ncbi:unnamed protein product [Paramecium sonneborni]|uniref:Uncharacterized protein n=1 Tax=Paramecium sonneborni TaxID=65129 RepID=A0A8S1RT14_9CILI|nr:unnamed protein product [Paramecium sonneborni]